MCLKWWQRDQPKMRAPTHCKDGDATSSSRASGLFSSKDLLSVSTSTSGSSIAGTRIKDLLPHGPLFYSRPEIAAATLNFNASQQIGSFAWKGVLRGSLVAIVRKPRIAKNFRKLLRNVHALHHSSLVKVVGGCAAADSIFVVYELIHGDNLRSCLCSTLASGYTVLSTWRLRMQVAVDVAKGLEYLHHHSVAQSAHKYLTSSNVMLTNEALRAKLALVGMAVLTGEVSAREEADDVLHDEASAVVNEVADTSNPQEIVHSPNMKRSSSIKIKGTYGYMPPEYSLSGTVSQKYDVFTFGIVLLELLKGEGIEAGNGRMKSRKVSIVDEGRSIFSEEMGAKGRLRLWIDQRLKDSYPVDDALNVVSLALFCVGENPQRRPTMREVALRMAIFLGSAETWEKERSTYTGTGTLEAR